MTAGPRFAIANRRAPTLPLMLAVPTPRRATGTAVFLATARAPISTLGGLPIGAQLTAVALLADKLLLSMANLSMGIALSLPRIKAM